MATQVKHRRGTAAEIAAGTPAIAELWFNTTDNTIHMGNGATPGGIKQNDGLNVRNFGAKGDGVTDDSAAFQAAIDAVGYIVGNPGDTYLFENTVNITSDCHIDLRGATINSKWFIGVDYQHSTMIFNVTGVSEFVLENGTVFGNRPSNFNASDVGDLTKTSNLIRIDQSSNINISNMVFQRYGSDVAGGLSDPSSQYGWFLINCYQCINVIYDNIEVTGSSQEGIHNYETDMVTATRLYFHDNSSSLYTPFHAWFCEGVTFANNKILQKADDTSGSTMNIYSRYVLIDNNYIQGGSGLDLGDETEADWTASNIVVSNNIFYESKIKTDLNPTTKINDIRIVNNLIRAGDRTNGIYFGGLINRSEISGNTIITAGAGNAIALRLSAAAVDGSGLSALVTSDGCIISNNIIIGNGSVTQTSGIDFGGRSRCVDVAVYSNTIKYCTIPLSLGRILGKQTYRNIEVYDNIINVPEDVVINSSTGAGYGIYCSTGTDTADEAIVISGVEIKNNLIEAPASGVFFNFGTLPAGKVASFENFYIIDNTVRINNPASAGNVISVSGNSTENARVTDVRIIGNNIDTEGVSGTGILMSNCTDMMMQRNTLGSHTYGVTLSGENTGYLRVEDNTLITPVVFRHSSSYTDSVTKKFVNRNGAATSGFGFRFTDKGSTAQRPDSITDMYDGYTYYDGNLKQPIYWYASAWYDAAGVAV